MTCKFYHFSPQNDPFLTTATHINDGKFQPPSAGGISCTVHSLLW